MQRALSTHLFVNHRLTTALLDKIQHAGIPAIEIFCGRQHMDYTNRAQVSELAHWFRDAELKLWSLHSPMYRDESWGKVGPDAVINICEREKGRRIAAVDEVKRALELSESVPFKYFIQHLGVSGEEFDGRKTDSAFSSLEELTVFGKQRGVEILLENIPNGISRPKALVEFLDETHLNVGFCFDTGHAHICGGIEAAFEVMQDRIRSTHVHDNDGKDDKHMVPLVEKGGTIDWAKTMAQLRSRGEQYPLLLELKESPEMKHPLDDAMRSFEQLESIQ